MVPLLHLLICILGMAFSMAGVLVAILYAWLDYRTRKTCKTPKP